MTMRREPLAAVAAAGYMATLVQPTDLLVHLVRETLTCDNAESTNAAQHSQGVTTSWQALTIRGATRFTPFGLGARRRLARREAGRLAT